MITKIESIGRMTGFRIKVNRIKQEKSSIKGIIISSEVTIKVERNSEKDNELIIRVTARNFKKNIQEVIGINANTAIFIDRTVLDKKTMKVIIYPVEDPDK